MTTSQIMEVTHQDITALKIEFASMKDKFDEMYYALVGNKLANDGGLVRRLIEVELEQDKLRLRLEEVERKAAKSDLYVRILWATGGFIGSSLFIYILNLIFKK